jgi:hypothetical protein
MANICQDYAVMTIWWMFNTCKKAVTSTMSTHYCITILEWNFTISIHSDSLEVTASRYISLKK